MIYVCIPSYNEAPTVGLLLWKVRQVFAGFPREYQLLVLDDGLPGSANQNCKIDAGETFETYTFAAPEVVYGVYAAGTKVPSDAGAGAMTSGSSFVDDGGGNARWVMFRPDGMPLAFDSSCNLGAVGSGGGAVYLNNGNRDVAAVLTPLGATRVHAFNRASNAWTQ